VHNKVTLEVLNSASVKLEAYEKSVKHYESKDKTLLK